MMRSTRWTVVLTHLPTGIEVRRTSDQFRHQYTAREAALRYLRYKLYALNQTLEEKDITYNLPDDVQRPDKLQDYKEK